MKTPYLSWRWIVGGALVLAAPFYLGGYFLYIVSLTLVYSLSSFGMNILTGYTNLLSLAGASFFGLGAYGAAILMAKYGFPFIVALAAVGLLAVIIGVVIAFPALRLEEVFLAISTLGFVFIFAEAAKSFSSLTGGSSGLGVPPLTFFGFQLGEKAFYYVTLFIVSGLLLMGVNLSHSRFGRAFFAVKGSDLAARSIGIPAPRIKVIAFAVSSFYCAVSGGLYGVLLRFIDPSIFNIFTSISFLSMIIIGGLGSVLGSVLGAMFVIILPQLLTYFGLSEIQRSVYGLAMILSLMFLPNGLISLPEKIRGLWRRKGA
ncbi:MAG: branched-chain amino acid ABC transporter permease [Thermodesulfobacteriota bacterium]